MSALRVACVVAFVAAFAATQALAIGPTPALVRVTGIVVDERGQPVEFATVNAPAFKRGASTGADGSFALELPPGSCVLEVMGIGYGKAIVTLDVRVGPTPLRVVVHDEPVPISEVTVTTSTFGKAGGSEGAVLNPGSACTFFGQGEEASFLFRAASTTLAPVLEEQPGSVLGCKAWCYNPSQAIAAARGIDEGQIQLASGGADQFL